MRGFVGSRAEEVSRHGTLLLAAGGGGRMRSD